MSIGIPHQAPNQIIEVNIYATASDGAESKLQTKKQVMAAEGVGRSQNGTNLRDPFMLCPDIWHSE